MHRTHLHSVKTPIIVLDQEYTVLSRSSQSESESVSASESSDQIGEKTLEEALSLEAAPS